MKVYVLSSEPPHDNSVLYGVYATLEGAMAGVENETWKVEEADVRWETEPKWPDRWGRYNIEAFEVQP